MILAIKKGNIKRLTLSLILPNEKNNHKYIIVCLHQSKYLC